MSVVACPSCGETYVSSAEVCADCGVPLTDPEAISAQHLDPSDDEVGYDLDDWEPDKRGELVAALVAQQVPHRWEDGELIVREGDSDVVEPMIDEIDHPDELAEEDDDDDAAADLLSALYVSSDVLMGDHAHPSAVLELVEAEAEARDFDPPYGVAPTVWDEIRRRASVLCGLLDEEADPQAVRDAARAAPGPAAPTRLARAPVGSVERCAPRRAGGLAQPADRADAARRARLPVLPMDPAPGFGGLLLGAVVAAHIEELDPDFAPELSHLLDDLQAGRAHRCSRACATASRTTTSGWRRAVTA